MLLIGASGSGKQLIIDQAVAAARDQVGQVKVTKISGLIHAKDISSALEFEFDKEVAEVLVLEDLVALSQHERWLYGLLEEARKYARIVIATSTKVSLFLWFIKFYSDNIIFISIFIPIISYLKKQFLKN